MNDKHWTTRSLEDLRYSVGACLLVQIEKEMARRGLSRSDVAKRLGVTRSSVTQMLNEQENNNFTLDAILRLSAAVGLKPAIVLYESDAHGGAPVPAETFTHCWSELGKPADLWRWHEDNKPCVLCE